MSGFQIKLSRRTICLIRLIRRGADQRPRVQLRYGSASFFLRRARIMGDARLVSFIARLMITETKVVHCSVLTHHVRVIGGGSRVVTPPFSSSANVLHRVAKRVVYGLCVNGEGRLVFRCVFRVKRLVQAIASVVFSYRQLDLPRAIRGRRGNCGWRCLFRVFKRFSELGRWFTFLWPRSPAKRGHGSAAHASYPTERGSTVPSIAFSTAVSPP